MKQIESKAEFKSNSFDGCDVAYPTTQMIKHIKNTAPGTIPKASALKLLMMS
jgi:hypothetical protein